MKLTENRIEALTVESGGKDRLVSDDVQRGLVVRVDKSARAGKPGGRTYLCRYSLHGQKWKVPLGSCSALTLADARAAAAAIMGEVAKGLNPAALRKEVAAAERAKRARNQLTLRVLIDDWKRLRLAERRKRYADEAIRALHRAFVNHLDNPAEDLDRTAVVRALDALIRRHKDDSDKLGGSAIAGRTAAYGRAAFAWAVKRGMVQNNPFAALPIDKSITRRERALNGTELVEVWNAAGEVSSPFGSLIRILILTGQRRGEVAGMTWGELSDDLAIWTMAGERTKNGTAHTVPLSEPARDLIRATLPDDADAAERELRERRTNNALVFPGAVGTVFSGWSKCKAALDVVIKVREKAAVKTGASAATLAPWSIHDLRRTLATGLQRLGVRLEVTEAILNHISGSRGGIAGVYQRHDWAAEKCAALDAWAAHVLATIEQRSAAANVLTFARAS